MKNEFTDNYPDLQTARERLKVLQQERDEAFKEHSENRYSQPGKPDGFAGPAGSRDGRKQYQAELTANKMEASRIQKASAAANAQLGSYQTRLEALPAGEKEYTELIRDRELIKERYDRCCAAAPTLGGFS